MKEGDLIGIADGFIIKFIGKAKDNPQSVRNIQLKLYQCRKKNLVNMMMTMY